MSSAGMHGMNTWEVWGAQWLALLFDVSFEQEIWDRVREFEVLSHTEEHSELVEDFSPEEWNVALASLKTGRLQA